MEDDHADSSDNGESAYDFVRKSVARDRLGEAEARKALVNGLVGRVIKPDITTRPGSVIAPKKGRHVSRRKSDPEDVIVEQSPEKPKSQEKKPEVKSRRQVGPAEPPKETRRSVLEQIGTIRPADPVKPVKPVKIAVESEVVVLTGEHTTADQKLLALTEVAVEHGDPRNLRAMDLTAEAAQRLRTSVTSINTHWGRNMSRAQRELLLYGEGGKKKTRTDEKFEILLRVRAEMREKNQLKPRKKELAIAAAKPLGMKLDSTKTYIYDRLTPEQVQMLDLQGQFLATEEQIAILKRIRKEMRDKGLPKPRQVDLATAAAKELRQKVPSVRVLIGSLSDVDKAELDFSGTRARSFVDLDPATIRKGFLGAISVLKLRKLQLTFRNLRLVLQMRPDVINAYLSEHPEISALLDDEKKT